MTTEKELREMLWISHGCPPASLYGDDGEMQCTASLCRLDFLRTPLPRLLAELMQRRRLHVGILDSPGHEIKALAAATKKLLPPDLLDEALAYLDPMTPFLAALRDLAKE